MSYHYLCGAVRWKRYTGPNDVRCYRAPKGWEVFAMLLDEHPTTGRPLRFNQWWIRETYIGD